MSQTMLSISDNFKFAFSNTSLINGIKLSECVKPLFKSILLINVLFSNIHTPQILLDVSIANVFNFNPP